MNSFESTVDTISTKKHTNTCKIYAYYACTGIHYAIEQLKDIYAIKLINKYGDFYKHWPTPESYQKEIIQQSKTCDILIIPYFFNMNNRYLQNKIEYTMVYPNINLKNEYIKRFKESEFTPDQIQYLSVNWNEMIHDCMNAKNKIELQKGEYVLDYLKQDLNSTLTESLTDYLNKKILPKYNNSKIDAGHQKDHIITVLDRSLQLADDFNLSDREKEIIYTAAIMHDIGLLDGDREEHNINSGKYVRKDNYLKSYFTPDEIEYIAQAVEDHRASLKYEPRSIYAKIISTADRDFSPENTLDRMIQFRLKTGSRDYDEIYNDSREHYFDKFSRRGYMKIPIIGKQTKKDLEQLYSLEDEKIFKKYFDQSYNKLKNEYLSESKNNYQDFLNSIQSPEELLKWMDNITYELEGDEDNSGYHPDSKIKTKTGEQVWQTKKGHCAEQSYLEKDVLENLGYKCQLVYCKENNTKEDYGSNGSAHVFLVYKDNNSYYYFEHAMKHGQGIHKFNSFKECLNYVAKIWWRCDYNDIDDESQDQEYADILEFRLMKNPITDVNNQNLAKECYKLPLTYIRNISNNDKESDHPVELNESLFTHEDVIINMEKWTPGNILFVTGNSGSGKSTISREYRQDKDSDKFRKGIQSQREYDQYLKEHIANVQKCYEWIKEHCPEMLEKANINKLDNAIQIHDKSKYSEDEWEPYITHFYGKKTPTTENQFTDALTHHYENNPHHFEWWKGQVMSEEAVIEMICDWWSFSWKTGKLDDIFKYYKNKFLAEDSKHVNIYTVKRIRDLMDMLKDALNRENLI